MTSYVAPGKTTKRVGRNVVFLLALAFAVLAYLVTPLTTFAACPNKNNNGNKVKNNNTVKNNTQARNVAVLMGKKKVASLLKGDKVKIKINGRGRILNAVYLGNRQVSVIMTNRQGKQQLLTLPLRNPGAV